MICPSTKSRFSRKQIASLFKIVAIVLLGNKLNNKVTFIVPTVAVWILNIEIMCGWASTRYPYYTYVLLINNCIIQCVAGLEVAWYAFDNHVFGHPQTLDID